MSCGNGTERAPGSGIGCACGLVPPEAACTPSARGKAPPDDPTERCSPPWESLGGAPNCGDGGCSADWVSAPDAGTGGGAPVRTSFPKGRPLKITNPTKAKTAHRATAVLLKRGMGIPHGNSF